MSIQPSVQTREQVYGILACLPDELITKEIASWFDVPILSQMLCVNRYWYHAITQQIKLRLFAFWNYFKSPFKAVKIFSQGNKFRDDSIFIRSVGGYYSVESATGLFRTLMTEYPVSLFPSITLHFKHQPRRRLVMIGLCPNNASMTSTAWKPNSGTWIHLIDGSIFSQDQKLFGVNSIPTFTTSILPNFDGAKIQMTYYLGFIYLQVNGVKLKPIWANNIVPQDYYFAISLFDKEPSVAILPRS